MENDVLKIEVAYSEIFKEQAYDLLEDRKNALKLREDKKLGHSWKVSYCNVQLQLKQAGC